MFSLSHSPSVSCLFIPCLSIFMLGGAALQFHSQAAHLFTSSDINPPVLCLKSLAYSSIIANSLFNPPRYSLAPKLSWLHICFVIPILSLNSLSVLSCRSSIQTPVCATQENRSVADYSVEFWTLAADARWNEPALQAVFLQGLGERLQEELMLRDESRDLNSLVTLAILLDNRLRARHQR